MVVDFFFLLEGATCINSYWHVASVVSYIFFSFFGEISEHRKKEITKDAKQMNISFIRERHWLFKEGTNANVKRCNKSTNRSHKIRRKEMKTR